ncbi:MAG: hypothetical protein ACTSPH_12750 [Promethearchaeota archaeon]
MVDYVNLNYEPNEQDLIVLYYVEKSANVKDIKVQCRLKLLKN